MTPETCVLCHGAIAPSDDTRLMSGVAHQQCPRKVVPSLPVSASAGTSMPEHRQGAALAEEFVVAANRLEHEGREWLQMDAPQLRAIAHRVRSIPALTREQARCLWLETRDTDDHGFPTMELWHWWHDENEDGVRERDRALAVLKRIAEGTP
jgi:hypothetical protein